MAIDRIYFYINEIQPSMKQGNERVMKQLERWIEIVRVLSLKKIKFF